MCSRKRGHQRMRQLDGIIDTIDMSLSKLQEIVKDWWTMDGGSWHCIGDRDQDHPCRGPCPSRIQGYPQDEWRQWERHTGRQSLGAKSGVYFCMAPSYPKQHLLGGSAYCLHTGHLKTLQQLDLQQKQDVSHVPFVHKSLSYHLPFRPANILWLAPGVTLATSVANPVFLVNNLFSF